MKNATAIQFVSKGNEELEKAENELCHPFEDVMCSAVCVNSRKAIYDFLMGYLLHKQESDGYKPAIQPRMTYREMIFECIKTDGSFSDLPIHPFLCSWSCVEDKNVHCFSFYKVKECYNLANEIKKLVCNRVQLNPANARSNGRT